MEYSGDIVDNKRHGFGKLIRLNEFYFYSGEWANDKRHGFGVEICAKYRYSGQWQEDRMSGLGFLQFLGGEYQGRFKDGYYDGYGTLTTWDGQSGRGFWDKGKFVSGRVLVTNDDGTIYHGPAEVDQESGRVHLTGLVSIVYPGGQRYVGFVKDMVREGIGLLLFPNGDFMDGLWDQGDFVNGKSRNTNADGSVQTGSVRLGDWNGFSRVDRPDGSASTCNWDAGLRHGTQETVYPSGDVVVARYVNGRRKGRPRRTYWALPHVYEWKALREACGICAVQGVQKKAVCGIEGHRICLRCRSKVTACPFCRRRNAVCREDTVPGLSA